MIPRGVKALLAMSFLFFVFVIGFLLIEQRQDVVLMGKEIRETKSALSLLDTQLQEVMMKKSKLSVKLVSPGERVVPVGYKDVYRVEISSPAMSVSVQQRESLLDVCFEWIRSHVAEVRMEI